VRANCSNPIALQPAVAVCSRSKSQCHLGTRFETMIGRSPSQTFCEIYALRRTLICSPRKFRAGHKFDPNILSSLLSTDIEIASDIRMGSNLLLWLHVAVDEMLAEH
jgi:hypothetical protein